MGSMLVWESEIHSPLCSKLRVLGWEVLKEWRGSIFQGLWVWYGFFLARRQPKGTTLEGLGTVWGVGKGV